MSNSANNNSNLDLATEKVVEKEPIYSNDRLCIYCYSVNIYPLFKINGSPLFCVTCQKSFNQRVVGYKDVIVEK